MGHMLISVTATQLCQCNLKATMGSISMNGYGCVSTNFILKTGSMPVDCNLPTPVLKHTKSPEHHTERKKKK